jgi:hypothetical protein
MESGFLKYPFAFVFLLVFLSGIWGHLDFVAEYVSPRSPNPGLAGGPRMTLGRDESPEFTALWRKISIDDDTTPTQANFLLNGTPTTTYPAVGMLFRESASGEMLAWCSATLIDSATVLTAAHCVEDRGRKYTFYLQHAGLIDVREGGITAYCDENPCGEKHQPEQERP